MSTADGAVGAEPLPAAPTRSTQAPPSAVVWKRVHPASPLVRAWLAVIAILVVLFRDFGVDDARELGQFADQNRLVALLATTAILAVVGLWLWLSWRMTTYAVWDGELHLRRGILIRSQRTVRLDRVQAIDVVQPFVARLVGLAALEFEAAGGDESTVTLAYLTVPQANRLRSELLKRVPRAPGGTSGTGVSDGPAPGAAAGGLADGGLVDGDLADGELADARVTVATPVLIRSALASGGAITLAVGVVVAIGLAVAMHSAALLMPAAAILVPIGQPLVSRVIDNFGFRTGASAEGVWIRRGMMATAAQSVPRDRIHVVATVQPWLWRRARWLAVRATAAGYSGEKASPLLLPVGSPEQVDEIHAMVGDPFASAEVTSLRRMALASHREVAALQQQGSDPFVRSPRTARILDPIGWRRNGIAVRTDAVVTAAGRVTRTAAVTAHSHVQSLTVRQGPLQRLRGVVDITVDVVAGHTPVRARHLAADVACDVVAELSTRARQARGVVA